jgi:hypothetical protein
VSDYRISPSRPSRTRFVGAWAKASEDIYVHVSGARIERRGFPGPYGWYLVPADPRKKPRRFDGSPQGCDDAFVAFAGERRVGNGSSP